MFKTTSGILTLCVLADNSLFRYVRFLNYVIRYFFWGKKLFFYEIGPSKLARHFVKPQIQDRAHVFILRTDVDDCAPLSAWFYELTYAYVNVSEVNDWVLRRRGGIFHHKHELLWEGRGGGDVPPFLRPPPRVLRNIYVFSSAIK